MNIVLESVFCCCCRVCCFDFGDQLLFGCSRNSMIKKKKSLLLVGRCCDEGKTTNDRLNEKIHIHWFVIAAGDLNKQMKFQY